MAVAARGNPVISLVVVGLVGVFVAGLLAGLLTLGSWVLEMVSSRRPSLGPPAGPGGTAAQHLASADRLDSSQISRDLPHTAEAVRRLPGRVCPVWSHRIDGPSRTPHRAGPWPGSGSRTTRTVWLRLPIRPRIAA